MLPALKKIDTYRVELDKNQGPPYIQWAIIFWMQSSKGKRKSGKLKPVEGVICWGQELRLSYFRQIEILPGNSLQVNRYTILLYRKNSDFWGQLPISSVLVFEQANPATCS